MRLRATDRATSPHPCRSVRRRPRQLTDLRAPVSYGVLSSWPLPPEVLEHKGVAAFLGRKASKPFPPCLLLRAPLRPPWLIQLPGTANRPRRTRRHAEDGRMEQKATPISLRAGHFTISLMLSCCGLCMTFLMKAFTSAAFGLRRSASCTVSNVSQLCGLPKIISPRPNLSHSLARR